MGAQGKFFCRFDMGQKVNVASRLNGEDQEGVVEAVHFFNTGVILYDIMTSRGLLENVDQIRVSGAGGNAFTREQDHQRLLAKQQARDEDRRKNGYTGMSKRNGS